MSWINDLSLTSKVGHGSAFSVSLPAVRWSEIEKPRVAGPRPVPYGDFRGVIVLCIDNDRSIIDGMSSLLTGWHAP